MPASILVVDHSARAKHERFRNPKSQGGTEGLLNRSNNAWLN
jgi:hypothetical protein